MQTAQVTCRSSKGQNMVLKWVSCWSSKEKVWKLEKRKIGTR